MKSKQFLFLAALGCTAAPVAAQTVDVSIDCGQTYTINSTVNATAGDGLTYRWLENGSEITGATADYTVPATKSVGLYTYIRQAKSTGCTDWLSSNAFTVEVKNKEGIDGVCLGGLMWAKYNVDEPGTFATTPGAPGKFYAFNRNEAYPSSGPCTWTIPIIDEPDSWSPANDPCPAGWRVPTKAETDAAYASTNVTCIIPDQPDQFVGCCLVSTGAPLLCSPDKKDAVYVPLAGSTDETHHYGWLWAAYFWVNAPCSDTDARYAGLNATRKNMLCGPKLSLMNIRCVQN
jgi:hypothetical protein